MCFRKLIVSRTMFGIMIIVTAAALAACSENVQSLAGYIGAACSAAFRSAPITEQPFLTENIDAMTKMMVDMGIRPTGDVDRDFVEMMVPHHRGAIAMAIAVLRHGHNERIKRLAQEIIVTQQEEIAALRLAVGESLPVSTPSPTIQQRHATFNAAPTP